MRDETYYMVVLSHEGHDPARWEPMLGDGYGPIFSNNPNALMPTAKKASASNPQVTYGVALIDVRQAGFATATTRPTLLEEISAEPCENCGGNCMVCDDEEDENPDPEGLGFQDIEDEERRIYYFSGGEQFVIEDVTRLAVMPSGDHRLETVDGTKFIVKGNWNVIEIESDKWSV